MNSRKEMYELLERKIGDNREMRVADITLESDEEFFLLINCMAGMADGDAADCPFEMCLMTQPQDVRIGKYYVPNACFTRKRRWKAYDASDRRLIGDKQHYWDSEKNTFSA